ncbi:MAG: hypothetical protein ACE5QW_02455 [Thermoplasmata archaeon]
MEDESHLIFRGLKGEAIFVMIAILYFVVARFLAVLFHEALGHGLVSEFIGGQFYAFYASPALGFTSAYVPDATPTSLLVLYLMAGLIAEIALGIFVLCIVYPRLRSFYHRLFALLLLEVLLVHSFTYLALGSFHGPGGDTSRVIDLLPGLEVFWVIRFVATGLFFTVTFAFVISKRALELLRDHFVLRSRRSALRLLLLFWLPPLAAGGIAGVFGVGLVSDVLLNYLLVFTLITVLAFIFASFYASRISLPNLRSMGIERRGLFATLIAFLLVLSVWFLAFGVTPSTAHGILFRDPPVEEQVVYIESYAVNLHVSINRYLNITTEVRLKAFGDISNPLEEAIWETFEDRPHWDTYHLIGMFVAKNALNASGWNLVNHSTGANVHGMGETWTHGKMVTLEYSNTNISLFHEQGGDTILHIYDPWKSESGPNGQYIDAINISWDESIVLKDYPRGGGLDPVAETSTYIMWIFSSYEEAHIFYDITFSRS